MTSPTQTVAVIKWTKYRTLAPRQVKLLAVAKLL